ncbi:MAG TPA: hypothetical protein DCX54_00515 [Flavobacteriales bacterium]|nr:hypothetical protein [Flavobacteriales bacterium]
MKVLTQFLIRSNLFVSLCAASLVWQTKILLADNEITGFDFTLVFLSTLFIYNFHRLVKIRQQKKESNTETESDTLNLSMSAVSFLLLIPCFWFLNVWHWSVFIVGGIIALTYSFPVFSAGGRRYSLRTTPYAKLFVVVIVWSLMTVLLPLSMQDIKRPEVLHVLIERFCFLLAITLPFDMRDMELDREQQVTTIPLKYGWTGSLALSFFFLALFSILVIWGFFFTFHNLIQTILLVASAAITFAVIKKSRPDSQQIHYAIVLEGTSLMQSVLIWISYLGLSFL